MLLANKYLGQLLLTVGKYKNRLRGECRGLDATGVRLDCHHVPHGGTTEIPRPDGTAVAIPEDIHSWLHRMRDKQAGHEHPRTQIIKDFGVMRERLLERGATPEMIEESLELIHARNRALTYIDPKTGKPKTVNLYDIKASR